MFPQLQSFQAQYTNAPYVGDTLENKGQCTGLVNLWVDCLQLPHLWGNAKDILANADKNFYDVIYNTDTNFPVPGDIIVWDGSFGDGDGHTAIVIGATAQTITVFEQNMPYGTEPKVSTYYNYASVIGWAHPKVLPETWNQPVATPSATPSVTPGDYFIDETGKYKIDYSNRESMKVTFDTWVRLQKGELVDKEQFQSQLDATSQCQTQLKTANDIMQQMQAEKKQEDETYKELQATYQKAQEQNIEIDKANELLSKQNGDLRGQALNAEKKVDQLNAIIKNVAQELRVTPTLEPDKLNEAMTVEIVKLQERPEKKETPPLSASPSAGKPIVTLEKKNLLQWILKLVLPN